MIVLEIGSGETKFENFGFIITRGSDYAIYQFHANSFHGQPCRRFKRYKWKDQRSRTPLILIEITNNEY